MNPPPANRAEAPGRALAVAFAAVAGLALWFLTRSWHASILDRYEFRQLQTALSTYWIAREGWSLDYLTPLFGPPWSVPMEFPTFQVCVAALSSLTGLPLEQAGRLAGILFLFATLPAIHDLLQLADLRPSRRLVVLASVLASPVYLFYARTFMIETAAVCFAVWFLAFLRRALDRPGALVIAAATAAGTLAALTKITTFLVFGVPALALAVSAWRSATPRRARIALAAALPATVALAVGYWWVRHGDAVKDANPFSGFLTSRELRPWNFGPLGLRAEASFWIHALETIHRFVLSEGAFAVAVLCLPFAHARSRRIAVVGLAGFAAGPLVFANLYHVHDYYYAANALLLAGAAGLVVASAWDDPRLPRGANWAAFVLLVGFQFYSFFRGYNSHHWNPAPPPPAIAAVIRDATPRDGVVLIYGADWNPLLPYYMERRAVMVPGERENETEVLEQVLGGMPPRAIAALVTVGSKFRERPAFIAERARRFGLAPAPFARAGDVDLYLPRESLGAAARLARPATGEVQLLYTRAEGALPADWQEQVFASDAFQVAQPAPFQARSRFGVSRGTADGRPVINAHAPAELHFHLPAGARHLVARFGLPAAAHAEPPPVGTDGVDVGVLLETDAGLRQSLFRRELDPSRRPGDRGPQDLDLALPPGATGTLVLRVTPGAAGNLTRDWAFWESIRIE